MPDQESGYWDTVLYTGGSAQAGNPDEACKIQHQSFNPNATYLPPIPIDDDDYGCQWIARQFGGPPDSNTILPSLIRLHCPDQYYPRGGTCFFARSESPECGECGGSPVATPPVDRVGNPMSITTGYKILSERDYETADGLLTVDRDYLSRPHRPWNVLIPGYLAVSGYWSEHIAYHSPRGGIDQFTTINRDAMTFTYYSRGPTRRMISFVATPSVGRDAFFADPAVSATGAGEMRLDMANGEYILFRRANGVAGPEVIRRLVPVERGFPGGYTLWYDYADNGFYPYRLRDSFNRELTLTWADAPGKPDFGGPVTSKVLTQIDLPDTTKLVYTYDFGDGAYVRSSSFNTYTVYTIPGKKDRLRSVERKSGGGTLLWKRSYDYQKDNLPHAMTAIRDVDGEILASYSYNDFGLLKSSELAGGFNHYSFGHRELYEDNIVKTYWQQRRIVNPLGRVEDHTFYRRDYYATSNAPRVTTAIEAAATPTMPADTVSFGYAAPNIDDHMLASITDRRGFVTSMTLDLDKRRPTSVREAYGTADQKTTTIAWHPTFDLPTEISVPGLKTSFTYDGSGQLLTRTLTDTTTQSVPYATAGQARTETYSWGAGGRLASINGPRAAVGSTDDITSFTYDTAGNLLTMTNGLGHVTTYASYDANGRPGSIADANGTQTLFAYDALGRLLSSTVKHPTTAALDAVTSYDYDVEGRVTGITLPATEKLSFVYDLAGQLLEIAAPDGEKQTFAHDAMGNITEQTIKRADGAARSTITRTFDSIGRMLTETLGPGRTTAWEYDKNGNPVRTTSPRSFATDMAFDALNRLTSTVAPDTGTTATLYNTKDETTSFTDAASVQTTFVRNGFGEIIQETSPDRGTSTYYYDAAGDLTAAIDGRGQRIDYARDILGRVTSKTPAGRPSSEVVTYTYDSGGVSGCACVGRLASMADGSGTTNFGYDHRGNLIAKAEPLGTLGWAYDLADRAVQITYPSGRDVAYARDTKGRVIEVKTRPNSGAAWTTLATNITYEPFGPMKSADLGNGLKLSLDWGSDRRLASKRLYTAAGADVWHLTYGYDDDDNITSITDLVNAANSRSFGYDSVDRLTRTDGSSGPFAREDYVHDKNGNRTAVERRTNVGDATPAETDAYARTSGTNRIASIAPAGGGTRGFTHDARGNLIGETRPGGPSITLGYDGHARLASYAVAGAETQAMLYNGLDERVGLTTSLGGSPVAERRYIYDAGHRITGEYGSTTADLRGEYIWLQPEVGDASPFGGDDGLGGYMPLAVAVPDGAASKLEWVQGNHLGTPVVTTDASGTVIAPSGYGRIGFPGQVEQYAGLYYNYYRDYDPTLGRYVQADPIGLEGSENPFLYVEGNPILGIDPDGLQALTTPMPRMPIRVPQSPVTRNPLVEWSGGYIRLAPPPSPRKSIPPPRETYIGRPGRMPTAQEIVFRRAQNVERSGRCIAPQAFPSGTGLGWVYGWSKWRDGTVYTNLSSMETVRFMSGNPNSRFANSQGPYVRWVDANGQSRDVNGRPVATKTPDAHIPRPIWDHTRGGSK